MNFQLDKNAPLMNNDGGIHHEDSKWGVMTWKQPLEGLGIMEKWGEMENSIGDGFFGLNEKPNDQQMVQRLRVCKVRDIHS